MGNHAIDGIATGAADADDFDLGVVRIVGGNSNFIGFSLIVLAFLLS